jgi:hypothetical protein
MYLPSLLKKKFVVTNLKISHARLLLLFALMAKVGVVEL